MYNLLVFLSLVVIVANTLQVFFSFQLIQKMEQLLHLHTTAYENDLSVMDAFKEGLVRSWPRFLLI